MALLSNLTTLPISSLPLYLSLVGVSYVTFESGLYVWKVPNCFIRRSCRQCVSWLIGFLAASASHRFPHIH